MFYSVWSSFFPIILLFFYSTSEARSLSKRGLTPSVVGHFMVGNTYPYTKWDWIRGTRLFLTLFASNMRRKDIRQASSKGLDAFALNLGVDSWQPDRIADAFEAADICSSTYGITFKLFLSFDMTSLPCSDPGHAQLLQQYVNQYSQRASYFQYDSLPVVSTFAGERCSFGQSNLNDAWNFAIKSPFPASRFIPSFFVDPSQFSSLPVMDGAFNWNSGWPQENNDIDFNRDDQYISELGGRIYMAAVSPWFFTHYGPETYNKNWIYRSDDWLFAQRWEQLIDQRARVDIVQVISWNDYGESHYVGPIEGAQPNSEAWTTGYDHQGWLDLMQYYISAYVTGNDPLIYRDRAFVWGRLAPAGADTGDRVGKPYRWQYTQDAAWGIVHLASSADVTLSCGSSTVTNSLPEGPSKIKLFLTQDCDVNIQIVRHGSVALDWSPPGYTFNTHPTSYNFNAFVAAY